MRPLALRLFFAVGEEKEGQIDKPERKPVARGCRVNIARFSSPPSTIAAAPGGQVFVVLAVYEAEEGQTGRPPGTSGRSICRFAIQW